MNSVKISGLVLMGAFSVGVASGSAVSAVAGAKDVSGTKDSLKKAIDGDDGISVGDSDTETNADDDASEESKEIIKENRDDEANLESEAEEKNDKASPENDEKFEESDDKIDTGKAPNKSNEADNNKLSSENNGKMKSVGDVKMPGNTNTEKVAGAIGGLLALTGLGTTVACGVAEGLGQSKEDKSGSGKKGQNQNTKQDDNNDTKPDPNGTDQKEKEENSSGSRVPLIVGVSFAGVIVFAVIILLVVSIVRKKENAMSIFLPEKLVEEEDY